MISVERRLDEGEQQIADLEVDWIDPPPLAWYYGWVDTDGFVGRFYSLDDAKPSRFSKADWREWLDDEIEGYRDERDIAGMIEWWMEDPEKEPVVVTTDGSVLRIWDGHHRVAGAIDRALTAVPAYVGFEV